MQAEQTETEDLLLVDEVADVGAREASARGAGAVGGARRVPRALRPERRPANRLVELGARGVGGGTDVEAHRDVGGQVHLDRGYELRREPRRRAVVDGAEGGAVVVDGDERVAKRED